MAAAQRFMLWSLARSNGAQSPMSALKRIAGSTRTSRHVRKVPFPEVRGSNCCDSQASALVSRASVGRRARQILFILRVAYTQPAQWLIDRSYDTLPCEAGY